MKIKVLIQEDWELWKSFRLEALKNSPESFGSSYEEEVLMSDADFQHGLSKGYVLGAFVDDLLVSCADSIHLLHLKPNIEVYFGVCILALNTEVKVLQQH
ncbi:TPA: hypothetical protein ACPSKV_001221 [Legionella bozemanae]